LRRQVLAAMVFNGHTEEYVNQLDEELFTEIQVMYSDGILGTKSVYDALAPVTTALFNYLRPANTPAYKVDKIFPWVTEYSQNPDFEMPKADAVNQGLKAFMSQARGFKPEKFLNG